jgi:Ni/Co efflux regulator RcnB
MPMPIRRCPILASTALACAILAIAVPAQGIAATQHAGTAPHAAAPAPVATSHPQPTRPAPAARPRPAHVATRALSHRATVTQSRTGASTTVVATSGSTRVTATVGAAAMITPAYAPRMAWNQGWHTQPTYDWAAWRASHRELFHPGYYYPPLGDYAYARLAIGALLAAEFSREQYWIADPAIYHLPQAYDPYRWVRYYNDCLLINIDTGEVVDVAYGVFW